MNDIILSIAVKKYGKNLGHEFDSYRCRNCNIPEEEFLRHYPSGGRAGEGILCEKVINERQASKPKPRVQNVSKEEFWNKLYNFYKKKIEENMNYYYHSFKDTFVYFWREHKINRSTFKKLFNEIYHERKFDGKNALHVYGSPTGAFRDEDRLPMDTPKGYREWSLWGIDDFDSDDSDYEKVIQ